MKKTLLFLAFAFACLALLPLSTAKTKAETETQISLGDNFVEESYIVDLSTGTIKAKTETYQGWQFSDYVALDEKFTAVRYSCPCYYQGELSLAGIVFFDENKTLIPDVFGSLSEQSAGKDATGTVTVPENAKYFRDSRCTVYGEAVAIVYGISADAPVEDGYEAIAVSADVAMVSYLSDGTQHPTGFEGWYMSDFIDISAYSALKYADLAAYNQGGVTLAGAVVFDADKNPVKVIYTTEANSGPNGWYSALSGEITLAENMKFIRVSGYNYSGASLQPKLSGKKGTPVPADNFTVTLTAEGDHGTISGAEESSYPAGTVLTVVATPTKNYEFVCWSDGETSAERTITVTENVALTAKFRLKLKTSIDTWVSGDSLWDGDEHWGWAMAGRRIESVTITVDKDPAKTLTADYGNNRGDVIGAYPDYENNPNGIGIEFRFRADFESFRLSYGYHSLTPVVHYEDGDAEEMETRTVLYASGEHKDYSPIPAVVATVKENAAATSCIKDAEGNYTASDRIAGDKIIVTGSFEEGGDVWLIGHYLVREGLATVYIKQSDVTLETDRLIVANAKFTNRYTDSEAKPIAESTSPSHEGYLTTGVTLPEGEEVRFAIGDKTFVYQKLVYRDGDDERVIYLNVEGKEKSGQPQVTVKETDYRVCKLTIVLENEELAKAIFFPQGVAAGENKVVANTSVLVSASLPQGILISVTLDGGELTSDKNSPYIRFSMPKNDCTLTISFAEKKYDLKFIASEGGSVSGKTEQSVAYDGTAETVTAVPDEGYRFVRWSNRTITEDLTVEKVRQDATYTAIFEKITYLVTTDADSDGDVVILLATAGGNVSTSAAKVSYGETLTITATAETGYKFVSWSDGNTDLTRTLTVTSPLRLTATFAKEATPSMEPSTTPSVKPSVEPGETPSVNPSTEPSVNPGENPSLTPDPTPSVKPSVAPSTTPSAEPSVGPGETPSIKPSENPSETPSAAPGNKPSENPSATPSEASENEGDSCGNSCGTIAPTGGNNGNSCGFVILALFTLAAATFIFRKKRRV